MEEVTVYGIACGNKDSVPELHDAVYECLEDAIQNARLRNSRQLAVGETSLEDVFGSWQQTTEADLSELVTAAMVDPEVKKLCDAVQEKMGSEISVQEAVDNVIAECMERNTLPFGWWGVRGVTLYRPDENY